MAFLILASSDFPEVVTLIAFLIAFGLAGTTLTALSYLGAVAGVSGSSFFSCTTAFLTVVFSTLIGLAVPVLGVDLRATLLALIDECILAATREASIFLSPAFSFDSALLMVFFSLVIAALLLTRFFYLVTLADTLTVLAFETIDFGTFVFVI